MTPTLDLASVVIGLGAAAALLLVYYVLNRFVFQRLRDPIFQRERHKEISKALKEGNSSYAWDKANIDLQIDKLSGRTRHETRLAAITHIETALKGSRRTMTRKQVNKLIEYLPNQMDPEVRLRAARLLANNVDALQVVGDTDKKERATEPDLEERYNAWKFALTVWSLELVGLALAWSMLDQLAVETLVSLALIAFVVAVIPLFGLAYGVRLWGSAVIVLAIVSGVLWLYAEMKHTGRDTVSAQPLADYGSNLSVRISYPTWLTADNIDIGGKPDNRGGQVVVTVQGGTLAHFAFADNPLITIRDDEGKFFNGVETSKPEEKFEVYLYVADSSALISPTTTITPVIRTPDGASSVTADELACPIELEPATWRSFRDFTRLLTAGTGAPGVIAVLAALWTLVPDELKKLKPRQ